ncbi:MAG: hypothetical protein HYX72_02775 [Acidobacteria bacterium]|nr:hypothetical protein [Acidobacteriota bacterium]
MLRAERVIATARLTLALVSMFAISFDSTDPARYSGLIHISVLVYIIYSLAILLALHGGRWFKPQISWALNAGDILWPAFLTLFSQGPSSPFFLMFIFVLMAAAYRWGLYETIGTAVICVLVLVAQMFLLESTPGPRLVEGTFEMNRFFIRIANLLGLGFLIGYLAEKEKELRAEASTVARIMAKPRIESGLRDSIQAVLEEFLGIFDARSSLLVLQSTGNGDIFLWEAESSHTGVVTLLYSEPGPAAEGTYFFESPPSTWHAKRRNRDYNLLTLRSESGTQSTSSLQLPDSFLQAHPFSRALLQVSFQFRGEWLGRLFLLDPRLGWSRKEELQFAEMLLRRTIPAVYNVYILRRLRSRASVLERARVAREIHDGVIQSVTASVIRLDLLRRRSHDLPSTVVEELSRIEEILRQECVTLRELMEQMKPIEIRPGKFLEYVEDLVDKFQRETGIKAQFSCDLQQVTLRPRVCREAIRIVQEALVNVRRHSRASNVSVAFNSQNGYCKMVIADDGQGFPFRGHLSDSELRQSRSGPVLIKERVHSLRGEISVDSTPGEGARLEILIPWHPATD